MITNVFVCLFLVIIYNGIILTNFLPLVSEPGLIVRVAKLYIYRLAALCNQIGGTAIIGCCALVHSSYNHMALCNQIGGTAIIGCCALVHSSYNHITGRTIKSSYVTMSLEDCWCTIVVKVKPTAADFAVCNLYFLETLVRLAPKVTRKNDRDLMEVLIHYNCVFSTWILGM